MSMVPTSTGAAKAISLVLPHLAGKLDGISVRVPTPNVSWLTWSPKLEMPAQQQTSIESSRGSVGRLNGILGFEERPLVSTDFIGSPYSSIVDADNTKVMGDRMVKVLSWYDNEWGFSNRMVDLSRLMLGSTRGLRRWQRSPWLEIDR